MTITTIDMMNDIVNEFLNNNKMLNEYKISAYKLAQSKYNWEKEQQIFLSLINEIL